VWYKGNKRKKRGEKGVIMGLMRRKSHVNEQRKGDLRRRKLR